MLLNHSLLRLAAKYRFIFSCKIEVYSLPVNLETSRRANSIGVPLRPFCPNFTHGYASMGSSEPLKGSGATENEHSMSVSEAAPGQLYSVVDGLEI
jgi:hypothetical protein